MTKDLVQDIIFVWFNRLMLGMVTLMVFGMVALMVLDNFAAWTICVWRKAIRKADDTDDR